MTSITQLHPVNLAKFISILSDSNMHSNGLSTGACEQLACFIDDVYNEGISFEILSAICKTAEEFDDISDLVLEYLSNDQLAEIKKEAAEYDEDWETAALEQIEEDEDCTILHLSNERYLLIQ